MRTVNSGSTKCDRKSILDARAQRRRSVGVRAAKAMLLESFRPWAPFSCKDLSNYLQLPFVHLEVFLETQKVNCAV